MAVISRGSRYWGFRAVNWARNRLPLWAHGYWSMLTIWLENFCRYFYELN